MHKSILLHFVEIEKKTLFTLLSVLCFVLCYAQENNNQSESNFTLKFYPTFLHTGEVNFGLCKNLGASKIEIGASYIYPSESWLQYVNKSPYFPSPIRYNSFYHSTGYSLRGQYSYRMAKQKDVFIVTRFVYKFVHKDKVWVSYSWYPNTTIPANYSELVSDKTEVKQVQLLFLIQFFRDKWYYLDLYYGLGVKHYMNYNIIHYGSTSMHNQSPEYPLYSSPRQVRDYEFWEGTINVGMSVGINIF